MTQKSHEHGGCEDTASVDGGGRVLDAVYTGLGSCPAGKFGDTCRYSCHCGHSCNQTTGVCGGDCDEGWIGGRGGTCQKENIAYRKYATSSGSSKSVWSADKAVDGNREQVLTRDSCFHASDYPSVWTVDLGQQYRIYDVRIYNRNGYAWKIQSAVLSLSNSSSSTPGVPCYTFTSSTATDNSIYDVICDGTGQFFTIYHGWAKLNLCEVEIYGMDSLCFKDPSAQTATISAIALMGPVTMPVGSVVVTVGQGGGDKTVL
ncbi:fucolectin-6-like [Haliotis asinina]|uniref:fucolectin-6-like n=1 Tax=Haliotis asinina TaxID=109174 RepID=UPI003531A5B9